MVAQPESLRVAAQYIRARDNLVRRRDKMLLDAYSQAQMDMATRIEGDMAHRQAEYGQVVFDPEAARMLDIEQEIEKLTPRIADLIHQGMHEQVQLAVEAAEAQMAAGRDEAGVGVAFGRLNKPAVDQMADRVTEPRNISNLLNGHVQEYKQKVNRTLLSQEIQGKNPKAAARLLVQETGGLSGGTLSRWLTVARTEMLDANRKGLGFTYQQHSDILRGKERMASLDKRTCMACIFLDGKIYGLDAPEDGHQNCRCTWLPVIRGRKDFGPREKRLTGVDWFKKQPKNVQQQMMGIQKWTYWKRDVIEFKDLVVERDNHGWRPAKYEASLKDALSFYDRTPLGRLMSEMKRLPVVGQIVPWLFTPADEVILLAWHGRQFRQLINQARAHIVNQWATPALLESGYATMNPMQRQVIMSLARGEIKKAVEQQLFKYYRGGFPRILLPTRGPVRSVDNFMHARMTNLANLLQGRLENILLQGFEQGIIERSIQLKIETYTKQELVEVIFDRYGISTPIQRQMLALPAGPAAIVEQIQMPIYDEFTVWGPLADDLRVAATVTPGEGYWLSTGGMNGPLIDATFETIAPGRIDPLRVGTDNPNGGLFFSMNDYPGSGNGKVYWTAEADPWINNTVEDLKAIFDAAGQSTHTLPVGWEEVGYYQRGIGETRIGHSSFYLQAKWQGLGFAEAFYQRSLYYYITHGVESVTLGTAEIGSYNWAKNWLFQFNSGWTAVQVIQLKKSKIQDAIQRGQFTQDDLSRWLNAVVAREERGDPMRSHELAELGKEVQWTVTDGFGIERRMHFGKMVMIGSGWSGTLIIADPTTDTQWGVPWPIPPLLMPRYPRLMDPETIADLTVNVENVIRAWIVSAAIETGTAPYINTNRLAMKAAMNRWGREVSRIVTMMTHAGMPYDPNTPGIMRREDPLLNAFKELRIETEALLLEIRNRLVEDPGRITLTEVIRQTFHRRVLIDPDQLEQWLLQLDRQLPTSISNPSPPEEPPPAPSVPAGSSPRPPRPPAPVGAVSEPFRPLPPPPVLNPWARVLTYPEATATVTATARSLGRHLGLSTQEVTDVIGVNGAVWQEIFEKNQLSSILRLLRTDLATQHSQVIADIVAQDVRSFLVGYLSAPVFTWSQIDLWDAEATSTWNATQATLVLYGIRSDRVSRETVVREQSRMGVDVAETVRTILMDQNIVNMSTIQSIYEALKYQGGFVPESSRRYQSRAVPGARPDFEYFQLEWGALPSTIREEGRVRLVDELTWALADNLVGDSNQRRLAAEHIAPRLAELTIEELINGLSPEAAMRFAWRRQMAEDETVRGASPQGVSMSIYRVTGSYLFRPIPPEISVELLNDVLRPITGEFSRQIAERIAANPDRPLQIAVEEVQRYVEAQPGPTDFRLAVLNVVNAVQQVIGEQRPYIDPALRRRVRQLFSDLGLYMGAAPATRAMEGYFVQAVTSRGETPAIAIGTAIRTVLPHVSDQDVAQVVARWRAQPLANSVPVISLIQPENRAVIRAMMHRINPEIEVIFSNLEVHIPVDEAVANVNLDNIPNLDLIQLLDQIRGHFGRLGLVSEQAAVDPIPFQQLAGREYDEDTARSIYYAYFGSVIPVGAPDTFLQGIWNQYRNNQIPRFPIDVDVRLRRALDIAEVGEVYNTFRHELTNFGERPLRAIAESVFESGWAPETLNHLVWLIESDPVLSQYGRPAPVEYQRFTYPNRGAVPNYTEQRATHLHELFVSPIEELYDSGEDEAFIRQALRAVFDSYYDGSMPLLPQEVMDEIESITTRLGVTSRIQGLIYHFSGSELRFDEAISEWLEIDQSERADDIANALDASRVIQRFREIEHRPPPLWTPIAGGRMAQVINRMVSEGGPITGPFRSPVQRQQAQRTLISLLNRIGLGNFTVDNIANAIRITYSMVEAWVGDEHLVEVAERMFRIAREEVINTDPVPLEVRADRRIEFDTGLPNGWYRIEEAVIQQIVGHWVRRITEATHLPPFAATRYVNQVLRDLRAPFELREGVSRLQARAAHINNVIVKLLENLADDRIGLEAVADYREESANDLEIRDIYEYWLEFLFEDISDDALYAADIQRWYVVPTDPDVVTGIVSNLELPGEWRIAPSSRNHISSVLGEMLDPDQIQMLDRVLEAIRLQEQVMPGDFTQILLQSVRNRLEDLFSYDLAGTIIAQITSWPETEMIRTGILPLVQITDNVRVAGEYKIEPVAMYALEALWAPADAIAFRDLLASLRFRVGDAPSDYHEIITEEIYSALEATNMPVTPGAPHPGPFGIELIDTGRLTPGQGPGRIGPMPPSQPPAPTLTPDQQWAAFVQSPQYEAMPGLDLYHGWINDLVTEIEERMAEDDLTVDDAIDMVDENWSHADWRDYADPEIAEMEMEHALQLIRDAWDVFRNLPPTPPAGPTVRIVWESLGATGNSYYSGGYQGDRFSFTLDPQPNIDEWMVTAYRLEGGQSFVAEEFVFTNPNPERGVEGAQEFATRWALDWIQRQPVVRIIPFGPWQDLRHAILNAFTDAVNQWGFDLTHTHANSDEFAVWYTAINDLLPEVVPPEQLPSEMLNYINRLYQIYTNDQADIRPELVSLPEWLSFWRSRQPIGWRRQTILDIMTSWGFTAAEASQQLGEGEYFTREGGEPFNVDFDTSSVIEHNNWDDYPNEDIPLDQLIERGYLEYEGQVLATPYDYVPSVPAPPLVMPPWPEPPVQSTWRWEGGPIDFNADLPGDFLANLSFEPEEAVELQIYSDVDNFEDSIYENYHTHGDLAEVIRWATDLVNQWLVNPPAPAPPTMPQIWTQWAAQFNPQESEPFIQGNADTVNSIIESVDEIYLDLQASAMIEDNTDLMDQAWERLQENADQMPWWPEAANTDERVSDAIDELISRLENIWIDYYNTAQAAPRLTLVPSLPTVPAEPVLPHRFPERPSDPYLGVVPEQWREEAIALRNLPQWRAVEGLDHTYVHARGVLQRYIESRMAGSSHIQALAEIHEDLHPGVGQEPPERQRADLANIHNDFMSQLMGGNRYGGAPDQPRTIEEVEAELQQMGNMQRPLGPDPEEIRLLREVINERLTAGMVPFQSDLQELAELTGASVYETLQSLIRDYPSVVDAYSIRQYLLRRLAAGFHVAEDDPYLQWLSDILSESTPELLTQLQQEIEDNPGPGTVANPPDPLLSEDNPSWMISWQEYRRRLEAVPNAQQIQFDWNNAEGMGTIEEALRQAMVEPLPEDDPRWDIHRPSLGASLRDLRDLTRFTQEQLRSLGITHVKLHRGESVDELEPWAQDRLQNMGDGRFIITGRAASSWSLFESVAEEFAESTGGRYEISYEAVVPIEQIAFMFPSFDYVQARGLRDLGRDGINYPTYGEFVVIGDVYADVGIFDLETDDIIEPSVYPIDSRALAVLDHLVELMKQRNSEMGDEIVQLIRAVYEHADRKLDRHFWQEISNRTNLFGNPSIAALTFVERAIKQGFAWLPTVSKSVQLAVLQSLKQALLNGDPNVMWRVMEGWRQLVAAGVDPKEAFERIVRQNRMAPSLSEGMAPIWQALEWEQATQHTPLQHGDVIATWTPEGELAGIARVAFDEVIDMVEGWRQTNLVYLHDSQRSYQTRIDQLGAITRPGFRWVNLSGSEHVAFEEQARRAALAGIRPGEEMILTKQTGLRSWVALYYPDNMADVVNQYVTAHSVELGPAVQRPLPPTPRVGSHITLDDSNSHLSFLDDRDQYVVRLLNAFPDSDEANRVAELYNMWKGGADTYRVQVLYEGAWPAPQQAMESGLGNVVPSDEEIARDQDLLRRMVRFAQEDLRRRGVAHVRLFRGLTAEQALNLRDAGLTEESVGQDVELVGRTMTSWSIYRTISERFAMERARRDEADAIVMTTLVPIEQVAMVFPPFPMQAPGLETMLADLVEGEFALVGNIQATVHSWSMGVGVEIWNDFLGSIQWTEVVSEQPPEILDALDYIIRDVGELVYTLGLDVQGAFDYHQAHEEQFEAYPGDHDDYLRALEILSDYWGMWLEHGA